MGLEQQKQNTLRSAEGLLRHGKVQEALVVLERMAASSSSDQLTLNRMGDLLARYGRNDEAVGYYFRIAVEFAERGFYSKAVAIHKKILRLNPDNIDSMLHLGELYLERSLPADARVHLLRAAELQLKSQQYEAARKVYQKLVEAEPADARHRVRLAEAMAADGDGEKAGAELLILAQSLLKAGNCPDAERSYRRAADLLPDRFEPLLGICESLVGQGQDHVALELLEQAAAKRDAAPEVKGALALRYEASGNEERTLELLQEASALDIPAGMLQNLFRINQKENRLDACWKRFDPIFEEWAKQGGSAKLAEVYRHISLIEKVGHLPAIQRWCDLLHETGDNDGEARAVEALVLAYQARSMATEAENALERLRKLAPDSTLIGSRRPDNSAPLSHVVAAKEQAEPPETPEGELPANIAAPAVPLNRSEEEFTAGRLTQAEILDKYGLHEQALQQVREVISRFPGSVEAQEKLVLFLRTASDREQLRDALVGLALAQKAVGALDEARAAAAEARRKGALDDSTLEQLEQLGLLIAPEPEPVAEEPKIEQPEHRPAEERADDSVVLIDFEEIDEQEEQEEFADAELPLPIPPPAPPIAAAASAAQAAPQAPEPLVDDLSAITAALESDVFAEETQQSSGGAESEQSIDEVFATFRKHVEEEVDSKDFRTHYDLGIAYKEMGFIDEAIAEFEHSAGDPDLGREVSIMLAMCYRDKGQSDRAIACYRQAIELPGAEPAAMNGLRYELAELLLETGDAAGALELFSTVHQDDPSFREVSERVERLQAATAG
jgi:tetratricopeptide (TPR) repeat protein